MPDMRFGHTPAIWNDYPQLCPGVLAVQGIGADADVEHAVEHFQALARERLSDNPESELAAIQAWRRAFARMGLKPTRYRCAAEALLRRFRKDGWLPRFHPLVDLCNAVSLAYAIPVAAFDIARIAGSLEARYASGSERYETFSGEVEQPAPGEIVFADQGGRVHARRWTNRQSGQSAVRAHTCSALIVAEALHETAATDVQALAHDLADALAAAWQTQPIHAILSQASPWFEFEAADS